MNNKHNYSNIYNKRIFIFYLLIIFNGKLLWIKDIKRKIGRNPSNITSWNISNTTYCK